MDGRTWTWKHTGKNETKWNETEKEKAKASAGQRKSFHGKWKIEALQVDEAYQTRVLVVNDISCSDRTVFSLFFSFVCAEYVLYAVAMLSYAMCAAISLDVLYLIMCGNPFSNEHIAHTHSLTHMLSAAAAATVHSGKGVRSLGKINVCFTWIKLNKLKRKQHLYVPQYKLYALSLILYTCKIYLLAMLCDSAQLQ